MELKTHWHAAWMFNCSFSIDEETDVDRQFAVNSYGLITTAKLLDRETKREHRIHVLATDKGKLRPVRSVSRGQSLVSPSSVSLWSFRVHC